MKQRGRIVQRLIAALSLVVVLILICVPHITQATWPLPCVVTWPAGNITAGSVVFSGHLADLGAASSVDISFEWGFDTNYGNETTPETMTATGFFSISVSGLLPDTTYHFRAKAVGEGTAYGEDRSFTTSTTTLPVVTTNDADDVTADTANLNGYLDNMGAASEVDVSFEWGLDTNYGNETTTEMMMATGSFNMSVSGLLPDTTYHFRAKAVGEGTNYGLDKSFTTSTTLPMVTTDDAGDVTADTATLNGYLNNMGSASEVDVSFEWGLDTNYGNETTPETMTATGSFNMSVSGLLPDTTYHFRAKAVGEGTNYGLDKSFTTLTTLPMVTTDDAGDVTTYTATLNGYLNNTGSASEVDVSFEWGLDTNYGSETTIEMMTATGSFNMSVSGLLPDTTYHFRAKAVGEGTAFGEDRSFTTLTMPLAVTTEDAGDVTADTATLNGYLNNTGSASEVDVSFEWGLDTNYGSETTPEMMTATGSFNMSVSGLLPDTTYYFRAKAIGNNTTYGADMQFTTLIVTSPSEAPYQPENISPASGDTDISIEPTLESSEFSDPDAGDTHTASHWQITTTAGDYSDPIFNSTEDSELIEIFVTGILENETTYYWHVRYMDSTDTWSLFSDETFFTTSTGSSGGSKSNQSCFIATAAYGTPMAEEIDVLRDFRDQYLLTNPVGEALVELYYKTSPPVADFISEHPALKQVVRSGLEPLIAVSSVAVNTTLAQKAAILSPMMLVSILLILWLRRRAGSSSIR